MNEGNFDNIPNEERSLSELRVLIAEDNPSLRMVYKKLFGLLRLASFDIAETPAEARELYEELAKEGKEPNVLVTDFNMPGQNGIELLSSLKELNPSIEGILVTSMSKSELSGQNPKDLEFGYINKSENNFDTISAALNTAAEKIKEKASNTK